MSFHDIDPTWVERLQQNSGTADTSRAGMVEPRSSATDEINYAALELELDRMKKKLAIWEIFVRYMNDGAESWPQVQHALSAEDINEIVRICDGVPLRDLLLDSD